MSLGSRRRVVRRDAVASSRPGSRVQKYGVTFQSWYNPLQYLCKCCNTVKHPLFICCESGVARKSYTLTLVNLTLCAIYTTTLLHYATCGRKNREIRKLYISFHVKIQKVFLRNFHTSIHNFKAVLHNKIKGHTNFPLTPILLFQILTKNYFNNLKLFSKFYYHTKFSKL